MPNKLDLFCREPYRLFFPLGVWMGIMGVSPWFFYSLGWSASYSGFFHSSMQVLVYMSCFVVGFLTTFIPRFTTANFCTRIELISFLFLLVGIGIFLSQQNWLFAELCYLAWLILLVVFIVRRIPVRKNNLSGGPPVEMIWLPSGVILGITGTCLVIFCQLKILPVFLLKIAKPMMEQGFLLSVVIGIGGFLLARILGIATFKPSARKIILFHLVCILGFMGSFLLEGWAGIPFAYGFRALIVTAVFWKTKILGTPPPFKSMYIFLAWISVWMIVLGLWGASLFPSYHVALLHMVFIGGFSLMTFAIATMVIMSHAGEGERLSRPLAILWIVGLGIFLALVKRLIVVFFPDAYFQFLGTASFVWILVGFCWFLYVLPKVFKFPAQDFFAKMHEEAKRRLEG